MLGQFDSSREIILFLTDFDVTRLRHFWVVLRAFDETGDTLLVSLVLMQRRFLPLKALKRVGKNQRNNEYPRPATAHRASTRIIPAL